MRSARTGSVPGGLVQQAAEHVDYVGWPQCFSVSLSDALDFIRSGVKERGQPLTDLIVQANLADETKIAQALADEAGLALVARIDIDAIPDAVATRLPITYAKQHKILPTTEDDASVASGFFTVTVRPWQVMLTGSALDD